MLPAALLWIDSQYVSVRSQPIALGDSYLLHHNDLYRKTREHLTGLGFLLDSQEPLASWYHAAPLLTLREILGQKVIPFLKTSTALAQLAESAPCIDVSEEILLRLIKTNVFYHESLHCVGAPLVQQLVNATVKAPPEVLFVLTSALVEAFANTVERLSFYQADQPLHLLFLRMNSYISFNQDTCQLIRDIVSHFGFRNTFRFGMGVLSVLNLREKDPTGDDLIFIAEAACDDRMLSLAERSLLSTSATQCWGLSRSFRDVTSHFFYRQHNSERAYLMSLHDKPFSAPGTLNLFLKAADVLHETMFALTQPRTTGGLL